MNIEKIKFGGQEYDLVPNGVSLGTTGGTVTFQKGTQSFDEIESVLMGTGSITLIGLSGEPEWTRADLRYTGKLTKQSNYVVGIEQTETGTDEETGEPVYAVTDIKGDVMVADNYSVAISQLLIKSFCLCIQQLLCHRQTTD